MESEAECLIAIVGDDVNTDGITSPETVRCDVRVFGSQQNDAGISSGTSPGVRHLKLIDYAKRQGFAKLITLPSGQNNSATVQEIMTALDDADVVVGSYHDGNPSRAGHKFLAEDLDITSAVQGVNLNAIPSGLIDIVGNGAEDAVMLMPLVARYNQLKVAGVKLSDETLTRHAVIPPFMRIFALGIQMKIAGAQFRYVEPFRAPDDLIATEEQTAWDSYWTQDSHSGKWLYDLIAAFYRAFIIRPAVNKFMNKYFGPGAKLIHAGCGSGMVDVDIAETMHVTALDISPAGLTEYARHHDDPDLLLGSIYEMPVSAESYDGVFNLGVMEHFHTHELDRIFPELNRILKKGGHAVLFWPPQWGLSVNVLRAVHWWIHKVAKSDIELHPPEYTRVSSRKQILRWCEMAGFELKEFYFGPRDFFTHQIVVLQKTG